jgi:Glycosyl transferase family 2
VATRKTANAIQSWQRSVSVFIPALNEEENLEPTVARLIEALTVTVEDYEIIIVDDGSSDGTGAVADSLAAESSAVRVLHNPHNMGLGYCFTQGYREAGKDFFVYIPGDNTWPYRLSEHWDIEWTAIGEMSQSWSFANVLARRAAPETIGARNASAIERYFRRPLSPASVYPLLHAADTEPDARFAYRLMTAMVEDFPDGPKEIAFLAQRIGELERGRRTLSDGELAHVQRVNADLVAKLVASGKPGVPRQMIALQRELYPS